jgi:hypothetical protein
MGREKDRLMEEEERGWRSVRDKYVCAECFDEKSLQQVIADNATKSRCDYCALTSEDVTGEEYRLIAAPFDSVMEVIAEGIYSEWNDADNEGIAYESAEGGYQARTRSSYDLVWNYVCPNSDALAEDIIGALPEHAWVKRHYYSLHQDQILWYGWENFCKKVKHENRYMFHLQERNRRGRGSGALLPEDTVTNQTEQDVTLPPEETLGEDGGGSSGRIDLGFGMPFRIVPQDIEIPNLEEVLAEEQEGVAASRMLDAIGEAIEEVGLVRKLPTSTKFFRARVGPAAKPYRSARELGPTPPKKATANRMSPAGIPMFYSAQDEHTAIAEAVPGRLEEGQIVNVGAFTTLEEFSVLDLTDLKPVPSLFSNQRSLRPVLKFLHSFVRDLSKPIKKDDRVHIEYVPSQIVTEYFRYSFELHDEQSIRGILYPSSRIPNGTASVLFFTREACGVVAEQNVFKESRKQWLRFVRGSAKAFTKKPRRPQRSIP